MKELLKTNYFDTQETMIIVGSCLLYKWHQEHKYIVSTLIKCKYK